MKTKRSIKSRSKFVKEVLKAVDNGDNVKEFLVKKVSDMMPDYPNRTTAVQVLSDLMHVSDKTVWRDSKRV